MRGEYKVSVRNKRNNYSFILRRNITILRGESGRGKSTLYDMIHEHNRYGKQSGVSISCDRELIAIDGDRWEEDILDNPGKIVVIDEDNTFIRSREFARIATSSDNYFLLITRNYLQQLPISVDEIYEFKGEKNKRFKNIYTGVERMYDNPLQKYLPFRPQVIITEDAGAGYQFFKKIADRLSILCISAGGKSKIFSLVQKYADKDVAIIADGAAFGNEIADIVEQQSLRPKKIAIYLPESFEWLILSSGVIKVEDDSLIQQTWKYADSVDYASWEQYYSELLTDITRDSDYLRYNKKKLSAYYNQERVEKDIIDSIKGIDFN